MKLEWPSEKKHSGRGSNARSQLRDKMSHCGQQKAVNTLRELHAILRFETHKGNPARPLEGTCTDVRLQLFRNSHGIVLTDQDGNGQNPLLTKAALTDNLLGVEEITPASTVSY